MESSKTYLYNLNSKLTFAKNFMKNLSILGIRVNGILNNNKKLIILTLLYKMINVIIYKFRYFTWAIKRKTYIH